MSILKKKLKYGFGMLVVFPIFLGLGRLIFGTGDVTAVLFILPSLPFFFGGMFTLAGIFDDFFTDDQVLQTKEAKGRENK